MNPGSNTPADDQTLLRMRSDHHCFGCGDLNPIGLHLRFMASEDGVVTRFTPAAEHQGYHSLVHGGIITAVLDEAMSWSAGRAGLWAVTGEMNVRFRQPLRVGEPTEVTAHVTGQRGRLATASAEMRLAATGAVVASATAKLLRVSDDEEAAWRRRYVLPANAVEALC